MLLETLFTTALLRFQPPTPTPPPLTFWERNGDSILLNLALAAIALLFGVFIADPLKSAAAALGQRLRAGYEALGFGFTERYRRWLIDRHNVLNLIGFRGSKPRLSEVYVALRLSAATAEDGPRFPWSEVFAGQHKQLVILGQPGAGKSTLLDYLVLLLSRHLPSTLWRQLHAPTPLYVRLRDVRAGEKKPTLFDILESPIDMRHVPQGYFARLLANGQCVVLLDGLDEVLDQAAHDQVVKDIQALASDYPRNWIVVTCRVAGWQGQLPNFQTYEIQEFSPDDVRQFIGACYREILRRERVDALGPTSPALQRREAEAAALAEATQQAERLWQSLKSNENLLRIARTPLILSLIAVVHHSRRTELPKGRAELYQWCLQVLLEDWDKFDKSLNTPNSPSAKDKLSALQSIAFEMLRVGELDRTAEQLEALVSPLLSRLSVSSTAKALIANIVERSGVLVEQAIGRYGFAHRALQDYLAAAHIAQEKLYAMLATHTAEERWREVILIAVGLLKPSDRAEGMLRGLLDRDDVPATVVAGWSLAEDIQIEADLRAEIRQRLQTRLTQVETAGDFGRLSAALLAADTEAARHWIEAALAGRDAQLRSRILTLLPELGTELGAPFVTVLTQLAGDAALPAPTRAQCLRALMRLNVTPDATVWQMLRTTRQQADLELKSAATLAWCAFGRFAELGLVEVPAGEFIMGSDADSDAKPRQTLYLPTFYIGKAPVTVGEWRAYVQIVSPRLTDREWLKGPDNHPMRGVSWRDALQYTESQGMNLPSEAEWEKAARGVDGREYPWANAWQANGANTSEYWEQTNTLWSRLSRRSIQRGTTPIGQFSPRGDSPCGCMDMAGNVWEWTRSKYANYPYKADDGREAIDRSNDARVLRGGSFNFSRRDARCACRLGARPVGRGDDLGFRVVVSHSS